MPRKKTLNEVTIKDVADLAGVSWMTVSRAIHNPDLVAEETRKLVQGAVRRLNYIPDISAGNLASRKSNMIAVMLPSLSFEGHVRTVDGLSRVLRAHGFHLLLGDNFYSKVEEMQLLRVILGRRPVGIVMINSAHSPEGRRMLARSGVPVVETWDLPNKPIDSVVGFSHAKVGYALTQHVVESGYSRIVFLGGRDGADPRGDERRKGFVEAMDHCGLDSTRQVTIEENHLEFTAGKRGLQLLRQQFPDADAVICLTDRVAMGVMMECRRQNITVPNELAIAGHGDFDYSEHLVPSLTTTRIDADEIGRRAAALLVMQIGNEPVSRADRHVIVNFDIIPRESTARCR